MRYTIEASALEILLQFRLEHHGNIWHTQHKAVTAEAQAQAYFQGDCKQGVCPSTEHQVTLLTVPTVSIVDTEF